jgi:hypothetical protein
MSKILSVVWYKVFPAKYGGQKGIVLFTQYLAQFHEVVLLCSKNNLAEDLPFKIRPELSKLQITIPQPDLLEENFESCQRVSTNIYHSRASLSRNCGMDGRKEDQGKAHPAFPQYRITAIQESWEMVVEVVSDI